MTEHEWLLVAAGKWPNSSIWQPLMNDAKRIIAVDGGANELTLRNITADVIIGDMDSVDSGTIDAQRNAQIVQNLGQEETDLVKALNWCVENGCSNVDVIGISGGRSDHSLAAFAALVQTTNNIRAKLYLEDCVAFLATCDTKIDAINGQHVSIFALDGKIEDLTLSGFEYELNSVQFPFSTRGLHNIAKTDFPQITYSDRSRGKLLVMVFY